MRLLILGGSIFLGRHLVEAALARGHDITLFNRGQHNPDLFTGPAYRAVEQLRGERGVDSPTDLTALADRQWDAAIDTSGYVPRVVTAAAKQLADAVEHYTFVSSISVYADDAHMGNDERAPVGVLADERIETIDGTTYGPLKALCEQAAEQAMSGRVLVVRPGLIVGPHDPTDRFTYWPARLARGGDVLAPGDSRGPVQFIDVRDLAAWMLDAIEQRRTGVYNATGPAAPLSMGTFLEASRAALGSRATLTWASEAFLLAQGVGPFVEMPLWVPSDRAGLMAADCSKALAAGLVTRPLAETVLETAAWQQRRGADHAWRAGLTPARERELLALWRAANLS